VFAECVAGGLACRDQRRLTGSGSTLEALCNDALYKSTYFIFCYSRRMVLSVTFVDHVKTNKHIFEICNHQVATPFKFFYTKRGGDIPTGTPLTGGSNAGGV